MKRRLRRQGRDLVKQPVRVEAALWRHFLDERPEARTSLFSHYVVFARALARDRFRMTPSQNHDLGDMEHFAYEGLLQAIDRFDPLRRIPFRAFARPRIAGNIVNGIGQFSEAGANGAYRRRQQRERIRSLTDAQNPNEAALERLSELAGSLAIGLILEDWRQEDVEQVGSTEPTAYDTLAWKQTEFALLDGIDTLPEKEAFIVRQHYHNGVSFRQIAAALNLSAGRVSQLHARALKHLQQRVAKNG